MSELRGKVCLITGASSGIGRVTAEVLAQRGARVLLACRDAGKTEPVLRAIAAAGGQAELVPLNLADLDSVRSCAAAVLARAEPLHVLINNAGLAGLRGVTKQGFEQAFGVNHLGHFLLTQLLLPRLLAEPHSRVVNVSSKAHYNARGIDFAEVRRSVTGFGALHAYAVSKLANVLHAKELARRYGERGLHAYSLHPGVIASDVWRQIPQPFRWLMMRSMISNAEGAQTTLHCATSTEVASDNGLYYDESRVKEPSASAQDPQLARELWERSERFVAAGEAGSR
ncbi:MAG: SDR family oxidoreductase [Myxococcales bacterium]|nr:MAG: SDR family oxidoreductase [Myxococcales bacterium]